MSIPSTFSISWTFCIWQKCPKEINVGRDLIEIAVNSSVLHYNDGPVSVLSVLQKLNLPAGTFCLSGLTRRWKSRIKNINYKSNESAKKAEKDSEQLKKDLLIKKRSQKGEIRTCQGITSLLTSSPLLNRIFREHPFLDISLNFDWDILNVTYQIMLKLTKNIYRNIL